MEVTIAQSVRDLDSTQWNALSAGSPLLSHAFLGALEQSGSVGEGTGWQPMPLLCRQHGKLVGAVPLYLKHHSYGEYVFDWSWAEAYGQHGLEYYPKLVAAVPFTPITGARLLSQDAAVRKHMAEALRDVMLQLQLSSVHILFPDPESAEALNAPGWSRRQGVQFRWQNPGFASFDEFLLTLTHDKRKKIRQERRKVAASGVICRRLRGHEITEREWNFFYKCYLNTYLEHHSKPYLTQAFFHELGKCLPDNVMLVLAEYEGRYIGAALNLYDQHSLYGRYWGALVYVPNLHFELCYYQAQEFCIETGIRFFEGGAQGEHKLARGFMPRETCSFHQMAHPEFAAAVSQFTTREQTGIAHYQQELDERQPYRKA
ncbi:hypothetical protein SAMN05192560_1807 [Methylobacillus rhizosphaerae]|uniref:Uncharacterized protein n=1 Tax=Methylobacillus rhizosphaerae TaxID=551994 RepID=A0A239AC38_9PROT|nr:GNAT family N-acetyltransferase [Methylobacillus rhizosphaerae]SNR93160.1 hypothetical protein SAMN05192560_1807 [Methylobacillus rhizosphaerae]